MHQWTTTQAIIGRVRGGLAWGADAVGGVSAREFLEPIGRWFLFKLKPVVKKPTIPHTPSSFDSIRLDPLVTKVKKPH